VLDAYLRFLVESSKYAPGRRAADVPYWSVILLTALHQLGCRSAVTFLRYWADAQPYGERSCRADLNSAIVREGMAHRGQWSEHEA
jgi:hypothetical protein